MIHLIHRGASSGVDAHADDTAEQDAAGEARASADFTGRVRLPAVL